MCHTSDTFPEKCCMKLGGFPVVEFSLTLRCFSLIAWEGEEVEVVSTVVFYLVLPCHFYMDYYL